MKVQQHFCRIFLVLMVLSIVVPLRADIQNHNSGQKPRAGKKAAQQPNPTTMVPPVLSQVVRGESVDIPIGVSPFRPGGTAVKILIPPRHGTLTRIDNDPGKAAVFRYDHERRFSDEEDTFTFLVTDPLFNPSGIRQTARILIRNPHATLVFSSDEKIDFGNVPLGKSVSRSLTLSNAFGSTISGVLKAAPPWHIDDDPNAVLREGNSKTFTISFSPKVEGEQSSRLCFDPDTVNLPELTLHGRGQAPFALVTPGILRLSKDSPRASVTLSNSTGKPVTVAWRGDSLGLDISPPVTVPPNAVAEAWVYSRKEMPPDTVDKRFLTLSSPAYSLPVKVEIKGPERGISLELLRGGGSLSVICGESLLLEGVVRNSSETDRQVDIRVDNPSGEEKLPSKHVTIPSKSFANFQFSWFPKVKGRWKLPVFVIEGDKVAAGDHWDVHVLGRIFPSRNVPPVSASARPLVTVPENTPKGGFYKGSEQVKAIVAVDLRPHVERGILLNHLVLRWRYFGPGETTFAVEEKHAPNSFTDRAGTENTVVWKGVSGNVKRDPSGGFSIRIPMPFPGRHEYRVYPAGYHDVMTAPVAVEISPSMLFFPMIRDLFAMLGLLLLWKFLSERF